MLLFRCYLNQYNMTYLWSISSYVIAFFVFGYMEPFDFSMHFLRLIGIVETSFFLPYASVVAQNGSSRDKKTEYKLMSLVKNIPFEWSILSSKDIMVSPLFIIKRFLGHHFRQVVATYEQQ